MNLLAVVFGAGCRHAGLSRAFYRGEGTRLYVTNTQELRLVGGRDEVASGELFTEAMLSRRSDMNAASGGVLAMCVQYPPISHWAGAAHKTAAEPHEPIPGSWAGLPRGGLTDMQVMRSGKV